DRRAGLRQGPRRPAAGERAEVSAGGRIVVLPASVGHGTENQAVFRGEGNGPGGCRRAARPPHGRRAGPGAVTDRMLCRPDAATDKRNSDGALEADVGGCSLQPMESMGAESAV